MDLCSRRIIGWSMQATLHRDLVIKALLMAVWNRNPEEVVVIHSDQGSHFGSDDWVRFCRDHGQEWSMSRRGNCYDNAAMESFFPSLKKERVRRRLYRTRAEARSDIFDYIEAYYNRKRRHKHLNHVFPVEFERQIMAG
jgi:putative transposase